MLGLGEHVERRQPQLALGDLAAEQHEQVARAGEAVDPDGGGELVLGLLHVEVAGADDHVDAATVSVPWASAAIACAPPMR